MANPEPNDTHQASAAPRGYVVIGQQMADAKKVEQERLAQGDLPLSPFATGQKYQSRELDISEFIDSPIDEFVSHLCESYRGLDEKGRAQFRLSLNQGDLYTLIAFAKRCAAVSLRDRVPGPIMNGLTALAMIELKRVDWRDLVTALAILYCSAQTIGQDASSLCQSAAPLAEPEVSQQLTGFSQRRAEDMRFEVWGYTLCDGRLVRWGLRQFNPTRPLAHLAFELKQLVAADRYDADVTVGTDLPMVWLKGVDDQQLKGILSGVVAGVSVSGHPKSEYGLKPLTQQFTLFVVEARNEHDAAALSQIARRKIATPSATALLAVQEGPLFCLLVARSTVMGGSPFETPQSILRFADPLRKLIAAARQG